MTPTSLPRSYAAYGALAGAALAAAWIIFDTGAAILLIALTVVGACIGAALDRPGALIRVLERIRDR